MNKGERVLKIRKTLKMTLEEFGGKLGVAKTTISRIEKGVNNLTDQMATAICRTYNVNYDYLVNGEGDMFSNLPQTILDDLCVQYDLDALDRLIVEMYIDLPPQDREVVKKMMKEFARKVGDQS